MNPKKKEKEEYEVVVNDIRVEGDNIVFLVTVKGEGISINTSYVAPLQNVGKAMQGLGEYVAKIIAVYRLKGKKIKVEV